MEKESENLQRRLDDAEQRLLAVMDYITENLIELNAVENERGLSAELHGRKCALVEVMERLMEWEKAKEYGYDWDVETEFPV